jgi:hypothetical protein
MNLLKTLTVGLLTAAVPSLASAATITFHIAGSTAFRAPVTCAIINYLAGGTGTPHAVYAGSSLLGGAASVFEGTVGGNTVIIEANWTGSLAGVVDLSTQNKISFPNPADSTIAAQLASAGSACTTSPFGVTTPASATLASGYATVPAVPDAVMSDSFYTTVEQAVSSASGIHLSAQPGSSGTVTVSPLTGDGLAATIDGANLTEAGTDALIQSGQAGYLGIVPFQWVLGNIDASGSQASDPVPFTNITQESASYLITNGAAPFSMFGDNGAPHTFAFLIGRNEDSGTRVDALAEPQLGFLPTPNQFLLSFTGGTKINQTSANPAPLANNGLNTGGNTTFVTGLAPWTQGTPINTETEISWPNNTGHGGYVSGGDVANVLSTPVTQSSVAPAAKGLVAEDTAGTYFIGYISIADAGGYVAPAANTSAATDCAKVTNGTCLTYDGVAYSPTAVNNGSYSFWAYEHMYYISSGTGAIASGPQGIADAIANGVATTYATFDGGGVNAPTTDGAGIKLSAQSSLAGNVLRAQEGGTYTLNY